jgi:predicted Ser/Thr protein kinase/SAM-dependent methyltransferase
MTAGPDACSPVVGHDLADTDWVTELAAAIPPGRRVFVDSCGHLVKVQAPTVDPTASLRNNDLAGEARMLRLAEGIPGVPRVTFLVEREGWQALGTPFLRDARSALAVESLATRARVVRRVGYICLRLALRGISHNDIKLGNVLIDPVGKVWLVDFDQATSGHGRIAALVLNLMGSHFVKDEVIVHGSLRSLARSLSHRWSLARQRRMPSPPTNGSPAAQLMWNAWKLGQQSDANAPGDGVAYYALDFEGLALPGERDWADRWKVLAPLTSYADKKVLELGCNMGLLSCYLQKYAGSGEVWGVDNDPCIVESARMVARALDVSPRFSVADVDDPATVDELKAFGADVITCLNVWNWVSRHDLLADLLSAARVVVFEGHDSAQVEADRLRQMGFDFVDVASTSERGRPILVASKEDSQESRSRT